MTGPVVRLFGRAGLPEPPKGSSKSSGPQRASLALPGGTKTALAGLVLAHAYALLDAGTLQLEAVSPAVPVALAP